MWTVDDTYKGTVDQAINNVLNNASPGGIVLMHDGGDNRQLMIQALPHIITRLRQQGYRLVTIPQLKNRRLIYYAHAQQVISSWQPI